MGLQQGTKPVNERSASSISATFLDTAKAEQSPSSARYRIDDITRGTKRQILDWTAIAAPSATETISITAEQNRILSTGADKERRQVTVEATSVSGEIFRSAFEYEVINLLGTDNDT